MSKQSGRKISRRKFVKLTGGAAAAAGFTSAFLFPQRALAQQKTLKILQWSHFVPGYDKWFDNTFTKEWGAKHNTNVIVDHIGIAEKSTLNPKTRKYFAFSDSFVPDPGNYRHDLWSKVGYPHGPDTWHDLLVGAKKIKDTAGNPCGLGLSQELDTNMAARACLWSFGGAEQDEAGHVVLNSKNTIDAVKFMRDLYKQTETPEVFSWDPSSNNRGILSGKLSFVQNAISVTRSAEKDNPEMSKQIQLVPALKGPVRRIAAEHVMSCYAVWEFAENKEGAKQFLVDLVDNFSNAFNASEFYNFPCFPTTAPDIKKRLATDPNA